MYPFCCVLSYLSSVYLLALFICFVCVRYFCLMCHVLLVACPCLFLVYVFVCFLCVDLRCLSMCVVVCPLLPFACLFLFCLLLSRVVVCCCDLFGFAFLVSFLLLCVVVLFVDRVCPLLSLFVLVLSLFLYVLYVVVPMFPYCSSLFVCLC